MRGFESRVSVAAALQAALDGLAPGPAEDVPLDSAPGRVLAAAVVSDVDVPPYARAAMDGWAVCGEDTFGASQGGPVELRLVGESMPGGSDAPLVGPREACRIMTGAAVPAGADAVLPAEQGREFGSVVAAEAPVTPRKNVGAAGEDVRAGTEVLPAGRWLRPQDVGLLASIGRATVAVHERPRVRIVVTGNELLPPGSRPDGNRVVDSNTPMLRALVERDGGVVAEALRLPDDPAAIREALARPGVAVVLAAGGSSVGREDHIPPLVRELGELVVHGIAMRPSSPAGIGRIGGSRVFLLPGNPVSCLAAYDFFAGPAIRRLGGLPTTWPYRHEFLPLRRRIVSQIGRTDYVRVSVRVASGVAGVEPIAVSGASVLSSTTRTDGFVIVPENSEGWPEGATVRVALYDAWAHAAAP